MHSSQTPGINIKWRNLAKLNNFFFSLLMHIKEVKPQSINFSSYPANCHTQKPLNIFSSAFYFKLSFNWNNALLLEAEKIPIFDRTQTIDKRRFKRLSHINLFPLLFQDYFDFHARYFSPFLLAQQNWKSWNFFFLIFLHSSHSFSFSIFETMADEERKVFSSIRSDKSIETTFCTGWSSMKRASNGNEKS